MVFLKSYRVLNNNIFSKDIYSIVPIRYKDRYNIMQWRNEQIDILRQKEILTEEIQNNYFNNVIAKLFTENKPKQLLFSYLENDRCIGYGGLVHIDWENKNAEISFLLDTKMNTEKNYIILMNVFLTLIEEVAKSIKLHKIFTYGYNLSEFRFKPLIEKDYLLEANLEKHVLINEKLFNVKIYSKFL